MLGKHLPVSRHLTALLFRRIHSVSNRASSLHNLAIFAPAPPCRGLTLSGYWNGGGSNITPVTLALAQTKNPTRNQRGRRLPWVRSMSLYRSIDRLNSRPLAVSRHAWVMPFGNQESRPPPPPADRRWQSTVPALTDEVGSLPTRFLDSILRRLSRAKDVAEWKSERRVGLLFSMPS